MDSAPPTKATIDTFSRTKQVILPINSIKRGTIVNKSSNDDDYVINFEASDRYCCFHTGAVSFSTPANLSKYITFYVLIRKQLLCPHESKEIRC